MKKPLPLPMAVITPPSSPPIPHFGRYELRQLLSRSLATTTWRAMDPRLQHEVVLCLPRAQPRLPRDLDAWHQDVQVASRLKHPRLADVLEISIQDGWPFVSANRGACVTLNERLAAGPPPTLVETIGWMVDVLEGLAYAHDAGVAHRDLGLHNVLIDTNGRASVAGLGVGFMADVPGKSKANAGLQQQRAAAEHDVLMAGLLMYRLLAGVPALDDPDLCSAAQRVGREIVRLPWSATLAVPDTLRAIVNRSTDLQQRQRYLNARTLLAALQGWIKTDEQESGGPLALLIDRLNTVGSLPSRPRSGRAFKQSMVKDNLRVDDIVDIIAKDPGLVWELLRSVNTARFQTGISDDHVTTITRSVVLMGQLGLRKVVSALRPWPGALTVAESKAPSGEPTPPAQTALENELHRTSIAGHIARLLAPFSISDEEALVAAISQRLGHLLVRYHFPDEAAQIDRLMLPGPPRDATSPPTPGMNMEAAASAVLGVEMEALSIAVMRYWGMGEKLQQAARPLSKSSPVRRPEGGDEMLRAVASLANELTEAVGAEPTRVQAQINHCFTRYARALGLTFKDCQEALETSVRLVDAPMAAAKSR
ncbi:HDOD domain-containing protein [Aquabacterium sp.]|uniref:serine/threonine protein kinase n=1 Tax=Aquabacterium sp. TaxID=1872578 RepID=UPI001985FC27|nr:HDOD domain-containing protein [Aquabacterium sp.]MBC7699265.1 HDOD domain-containing protein [Aquabacterium sp.]